MSDREFLEYNIDNIFKNLLQAEYHAKNIIGGKLQPEHLSCINKHLAFVEGEAEEATAHCIVGEPDLCEFFREFLQKVKKLRQKIKKEGAGSELQHEIRKLRKEIEGRFKEYDTSECRVCKIIDNLLKSPKEVKKMGKISDNLEKELRDAMGKSPEALSAILEVLEEECYEIADHVRTNWQDKILAKWWERMGRKLGFIATEAKEELGDPVSPEEVKKLEQAGYKIKAHPICVISKMAKGKPREKAEAECLAEGKVHPISFWAAEVGYGRK